MTALPRASVAVARARSGDRSPGHQGAGCNLRGRASRLGLRERIRHALASVGRRVACSLFRLRNAPWPVARHPRMVILVGLCKAAASRSAIAKILRRSATSGRRRAHRSRRHCSRASRRRGPGRSTICLVAAESCSRTRSLIRVKTALSDRGSSRRILLFRGLNIPSAFDTTFDALIRRTLLRVPTFSTVRGNCQTPRPRRNLHFGPARSSNVLHHALDFECRETNC